MYTRVGLVLFHLCKLRCASVQYLDQQFGYSVYRTVLGYYSGAEDAYGACICVHAGWYADDMRTDMRKAMPRDVEKKSIIPLKRPVRAIDLEED